MTAALEDLAALTEDELMGVLCGDDDTPRAAAAAEIRRRERSAAASLRARRAWRERSQPAGWHDAAHAQAIEAEAVTNGYMLSDYGKSKIHGEVFPALWRIPERELGRYITEELDQFFRGTPGGRLTPDAYRAQIAASEADEYETACREHAAAKGTETSMGLGHLAMRGVVNAARANAQRQRQASQGMTHEEYQQRTAAVRERLASQRERRQAAASVGAMVAEAQQAQAAQATRQAHQALAVPAQSAPVRQRQQVDGATVLGYVRAWLAHYARLPESALDAVTLWAAHACAKDGDGVLLSDATPRLMFLSSEPGSGKSRVLELVSLLCASRYGLLAEPTAAAVAHMLGAMHEPAFLDEADVLFGSGKRKESLRALLNAGYTRAGITLHMRGGKPVELPVFGPVALAGLDVVKTATAGNLAPLLSRSIIVRMRKSADRVPQLNGKTRQEGAMLHAALAAWAQQERDTLAGTEAEVPDWLTGRAAEIWAPLFVLAGTAGGDWPERVMIAAEDLALAPELAGEETDDLMAGLAGMAAGWE